MRERKSRVLFVDDDPRLLAAVTRVLHTCPFELRTATDGRAALEALRDDGPFAVIVSDLRMPGMDGVTLLRQARETAPDTVRILLTGQADLEGAVSAINEGNIFRFITKPCPVLVFQASLRAAVEQHRLVTAERVLLGQTLHGSIQALTEVLAAVSPAAFGRATRLCRLVGELIGAAGIRDKWHVEVAAMLSQIACVTLPPDTLLRLYRGEALSPEEAAMVERMPAIAEQVLGSIPRLEPVLAILRYQYKNYNGSGPPRDAVACQDIPWGARALKLATDFDALTGENTARPAVLHTLRSRTGVYDPVLLDLLCGIREGGQEADIQEVALNEVRPGMIFAQDVKTRRGGLILARGQLATPGVIERLNNFSLTVGVQEPFRVILREARPAGGVTG